MKKTLKFLLFSMTLAFGVKDVNAACSYSEKASLNQEVANIRVRHEIKVGEEELPGPKCTESEELEDCYLPLEYEYFDINILNMSEKFYVKVTEDTTHTSRNYHYSDADENGIIHIKWDGIDEITKFTINVYSSDETNCPNERLRVIYETTPRKNFFSDYDICKEVPDFYLCKSFVTYAEDAPFTEFVAKVEEEIEKREDKSTVSEKSFWNKILDFIKKNKVVIIACTAVIVVVAGGTVYIIKKRRDI